MKEGICPLSTTLAVFLALGAVSALQCMDENNEPVDWYIMYKIPKLESFIIPMVKKGKAYMFINSKTIKDGWMISPKDIFNNETSVANTLAPYYKGNSSELWMMYNDQLPSNRKSRGKGHTKGVVGADSGSGFWLVHSVPLFPPLEDKYAYAASGVVNGQTFLCISLPPDQLNILGANVLRYNRPQFYNVRMISPLNIVYHELYMDAQGASISDPPWYKMTNLTTLSSNFFLAFAKAKQFDDDIYRHVANDLEADILTETWLDGVGKLQSDCSDQFKVENIQSISYKGITFNSTHDHSKWAISANKEKPWTCIGDLNRAKSQEQRGGGTLCMNNPDIWEAFRAMVDRVEECKTENAMIKADEQDISNAIPFYDKK